MRGTPRRSATSIVDRLAMCLPLRCRRAAPALEFALIAPIIVIVLMGVYDLTNVIITERNLTIAAQEVAEIASALAAQPGSVGTLSTTRAAQAMTAPMAQFPLWSTDGSSQPYGITLSAVVFVPARLNCASNCTYLAFTAWSLAKGAGLLAGRPCGQLVSVGNAQPATLTTLPVGVFSAGSILVADVATVYTPMFTGFITGPLTIQRSAYLPPRELGSANYIELTPMGSAVCGGYV